MHVFAGAVYAFVIFLLVLAYVVSAGAPLLILLVLVPIFISGAIVLLLAASLLVGLARWLWLSRGTLRLRRSL